MTFPAIITCLCLFTWSCLLGALPAAVVLQPLAYEHDGVRLQGTLALPEAKPGTVPGVLVVHEWWGRNDYADRRARELAEAGYVALALDMYGAGKVTEDPQQAGAWAGPFYQDRELLLGRARAGLEQLRRQPMVDGKRIAAIGFCFGGSVCLELARAGEALAGVVSFHGGLATHSPAAEGGVKARMLVLHGGADPLVPPGDVARFIEEMTRAKADWRLEIYGRALHAFTNPAAARLHQVLPGVDYHPEAERRAIAASRAFLAEILGTAP